MGAIPNEGIRRPETIGVQPNNADISPIDLHSASAAQDIEATYLMTKSKLTMQYRLQWED